MAIEGAICEGRLGLPGSGKSLDQTLNAVLPHLLDDEEVWCCYWLNWNKPNFHYFQPKDFDAVKDLRNAVVVFDELAQTFEPRDWEGESSQVRSFFQLHRHRHLDIYFNTQDVSLVAKTVGIIADQWIRCEKGELTWLDKLIGWLIAKPPKVKVDKQFLTYQQLKKIANGWELGEDVAFDIEQESIRFDEKMLLREDLNEFKVELVHRYCEKCCSRQGDMIKKEDTEDICDYDYKTGTYSLKKEEYCPKHKDVKLTIRKTGIYDTDYEPEIIKKNTITKEFKVCTDCGSLKPCR